MNDDQLGRELRRRADSVTVDADWTQRELVRAVSVGIQTQSRRVAWSPTAALAGLAATLAVLAVLVVAIPRLGPGPSGDESRFVTAMSPREFALRYLGHQLNGHTVVVDGRIVPDDVPGILYGTMCQDAAVSEGDEPPACTLGRLAVVDSNVWISGRYVETAPEVWEVPVPPVGGLLVFEVSSAGFIELLGKVDERSGDPFDPEAASQLDIATFGAHDIVLVKGWLVSPEGPDTNVVLSCAVGPPFTPVPGLPDEYCQPSDSIASERITSGRGNFPPGPRLVVQRAAAETFGVTGEQPAIYAVAPRLHALCLESAPCWEWEVIAQITERSDFDDEPLPTSPPTPDGPARPTPEPTGMTFECRDAASRLDETPAPRPVPIVVDRSGLVESCEVVQPTTEHSRGLWVTNIILDETVIHVEWSGTPCDRSTTFEFRRLEGRFELSGIRPEIGCDDSLVRHAIRVQLRQPVAAALVDASIEPDYDFGPLPTPEPVPTPQIAGVFECVGPPLPPGQTPPPGPLPRVVDETGLVTGCLQPDVMTELTGEISLSYPFPDAQQLHVVWAPSRCDAAIVFTFRRAGDGYELIGERPNECASSVHGPPMAINFSMPVPLDSISAQLDDGSAPLPTANPSPDSGPATVSCPYASEPDRPTEMSIVDHSGSVVACEAFVEFSTPDQFVDVSDNTADPSVLEVRWEIAAVCTSMPVQLELWGPLAYEPAFAQPPAYAVEIAGQQPTETPQACRPAVSTQGVTLTLRSGIPSADLVAFRTLDGRGMDQARAGEHTLSVELTAGKLLYTANEPIDVSASILYSGPLDEVTLSALGANPGFGFQQLDGNARQSDGGDLVYHFLELRRGVPLTVPYRKSGAFIPGDYPNPDAERAYASDPELRLPPGLYRIYVSPGGVINGMGRGDDRSIGLVRASIVIEVVDEGDREDVAEFGGGAFELSLSSSKLSYSPSEQVDVTAQLVYRGRQEAVPISGLSVDFTVQQLDGPLSLVPGPTIPIPVCSSGEIQIGESREYSLADAVLVHGSPQGIQYNPDPFVLPHGVYRVHVDVRFAIGQGCTGQSVALQAWMLVRVE